MLGWRQWVAATLAVVVGGLLWPEPSSSAQSPGPGSPFTYRGVIEGFYGPPWSPTATTSAMEWMGEHGLNLFAYAPKDDPYERANWRDPYPQAEMDSFRAEIAAAQASGVSWVPDISPGLPLIPGPPAAGRAPGRDICFSCPTDLGVLYAKLDPFLALGVRTFMISFDDVARVSSHPEDAARHGVGQGAFGAMTRDLLNAVYEHYQAKVGAGFNLLTVLADYSGTSDTDYLRAIRAEGGLEPGIQVLWTGTAVVSKTIRGADAAAYARLVGRDKVLIWDNYPVNDYAGGAGGDPTRLFLGPYRGRSTDLAGGASGVLANPMIEPMASRLPLATMATYLADPSSYDPEAAWRTAIADLAGFEAPEVDAVAALAENSRSSTLDPSESPVFVSDRDAFLRALGAGPFWTGEERVFAVELEREGAAPATMRARQPALAAEVNSWLDALAGGSSEASAALNMLVAQRPALGLRSAGEL